MPGVKGRMKPREGVEYVDNPPHNPDGTRHHNQYYPKMTPDKIRLLGELAKLGCSYAEMANILDVDKSLLSHSYKDLIDKGRANLNRNLRKRQIEKAVNDGDVTMLIFLGKQLLGQREKTQTTNSISFEKLSDAELEAVISECEGDDPDASATGASAPELTA